MRFSALLDEVAEGLDSVSGRKWSLSRLGKHLNVQQRSLVRNTSDLDEKYHNATVALLADAARREAASIHSWRLPPWVMKVSAVRRRLDSGLSRDHEIPRLQKYQSGAQDYGWELTTRNTLELRGTAVAQDLDVLVSKLPALMTKGTLPSQAGAGTSQLHLDSDGTADATDYPHEAIPGAYTGALFEITGPASARKGQILRCVGSTPNTGAGLNMSLLDMEEDWSVQPAAGDTYEMHAEVEAEHARLLVLLTIRACFAQEKNVQGIAAYREEMAEQWALYQRSISLRTLAGPNLVVESLPFAGGVTLDSTTLDIFN